MADRTPYDDLLQQDTAQALRSSMSTAVDRQPDVEARLQTLARDYQMPVEAVRVRQTEIERKARLDAVDYDTLAREFPKTANTLADPMRAGIAHDDVDNMTMLERIGGGLKATAKYLFSAPDSRNTLMGDLGAGIFRLSRNSAGVFRAGFEGAAPALDVLEPVQAIGGNPLRRVAEGFDMLAQQAGARADQLSPPQQDIVGSGVSSGVQSLAQQAPALALSVFNPFAGMLLLAGGSGGGSYQAAREKGVSPMRSLGYGMSDAVVEYATEKIPMSRLLGDLKQGAPILQTLLRNAATEIPGEQVATVLQDLNEWATINPDKPFSDYLAERPSAAAQTLIATLVGVGGNVALGSAVQTVADRAAGVERDVQQAEAHAKVLGEFAKLAEASKVRERDPASFATFLQTLTEDGVPNVYVDAKALLQAADVNEVALALPSVAEQIAEAAATGGDVVIPTAELLTAGPGQTFMQTLLDNARTAPDAMSAVEAREYMQSKGDQLKADIDQVLQKQEQDASWQEMRNQLRDEFKAQLDQVKRFTGDVNTQYANLLANFYAVTAAKLGMTPQELATRYGLRVQSRGVEGGQQLDQGGVQSPRNLITAHNLTADNLRAALEMGGLPAPSLAITKIDAPIQGFGEITLVGDAKLATPSAKNPVFDADVYSPRFPAVKVKVDEKAAKAALQPLMDAAKDAGLPARRPDSVIEELARNRLSSAVSDLSYDSGMRLGYAIAVLGKPLTVPTKEVAPAPVAKAGARITEQSPLRELLPTLDVGKLTPDTAGDLGQKVYAALVNKTLADMGAEANTPAGFDKLMGLVNRRIRLFAETEIEPGSTEFAPEKVGKMTAEGLYSLYNLVRSARKAETSPAETPPAGNRTEVDIEALGKLLDAEAPVDEFKAWAREQLRPAMGEKRVVTGSGRTAAFTLDNIVREMTRKVRDAEGFNYGLGNARSKGATKFKSLAQIQGQRDRVVSNAEFDAARKEIDTEFADLARAVTPFQRYERDNAFELLAEALGDSYSMPLDKALEDAALVGVPADLQQRIAEFAAALVGAPTEYFEAKPQRAVGLGEFRGAVIPDSTPADVRAALADLGMTLAEYRKGDEASRTQAVRTLSEQLDAGRGDVLFQEARGSINLPDDLTRSPAIISLFQGADLSTFLHESGHFFLELQMDLAARIQAQIAEGGTVSEGEQSIVNDANALLAWFGVKGDENRSPLQTWATMDLETKRPLHEQFARGFEAYAFEGNAPSLELQGMFQKFRAWLLAVYKELRALRVELTDDVRGVMDRMLATTEAIQTAEAARRLGPLFKTAEEAGMALDEFKAYHDLATDASQVAIEELQARGLRDMKWLQGAKDRKLREMQKLHDSLRREVRAEVRREVMSQPVYRAWQFLTGKGAPDETAQPADKAKAGKELDVINDDLLAAIAKLGGLRKEEAISLWGVDPKEKVESGVFGAPVLRREGGLDVDTMGERLVEAGYLRPDENGKHDPQEFEEAFAAALRGETVYSMWHEYSRQDDAEPAQQLPENVAFGKLDTREMEARYGAAEDAPWRKLQAARMTSASRGISADVIAEVNGFGSGDEMVKALIDAEPPQSVIEGMTDQRMLERFGDLGTPEGLQRAVDSAIHNEARARFLSTEIAALERGMRVRADTGRVNANGQRVTVDIMAQVAKQQAERIVGATKVKNLRPSQYTNAETRAARAAERAMLAGKTEDALAEKRHQLINLQAARAATKAQEDVEKITAYLRRFNDKPKGLDADYYDQIAQLLERFDLARGTTLKDIAKRKSLMAWVESQREQGMEPEIPPELLDEANRTSYKDMTVDELRGLRDTVRQIEKLGRVKNTLLTAKKNRDFQAVRDEVADSIYANANGRKADTRTPAAGSFAAWFKKVKDFGAAHIKAATWARVFDGGKDGGPVWEYFIRPANEAADMETRMRAEATEKLHAILAPALAKPMGGKGTHFPTIGRAMNREQVFAMALNMGNEGNIQRMLDGEGWTVQQIQPVLATLSAADWQAVQAVWDHFESYRPLIGAKERRIYGKEPAWVEPMPLSAVTSDGQTVQLRGGYYPVKYDPLANNRAEQHADAEDAKRQMQAAYTSATTRRGFTKARAEAVKNRPLLYSLAGVYSGVNDVIHDLAFHEWLIDVNKLLRSDKINDAIRTTYGPEAVRQLKTWIEDTARGEQGLQAELDSMLGRLRQGVSIAGLGFNVMSAAMQPLGLSQSVVRIGGKWVGKGVAQYLAAPREKARWVNERSDFMASRARTRFRELNELRAQVEGEHPVRTWASNAAFFMMTRMQMTVDIPTWLGAYEKAVAEGNSDERAGQLADQAVIDAQGGGQMKDLSAIERGGPAQKLFTVFYSFMNTALNIGVAQTMTEKSRAKLAADYLLLYSVPAVLGAVLKDALTPGDSGDWDDMDKILRKLIGEQLGYLFGLMVGVREFGEAAKSAMGLVEHSRDYQGPAGVRMIADTYSLAKQVSQGELDDLFRKASINVLGDLFGLPSAQINRTVTGAQALAEGETDNPFALAFGYQQP